MPRVTRSRTVTASRQDVWGLVSDPYAMPRWWPQAKRVENVELRPGGRRSEWTAVLQTAGGRGVRVDYRCTGSTKGERYAWAQQLDGTPFERHLRSSEIEVLLAPAGDRTEVTLRSTQALRGLSRLGAPMMRGGQRRILDDALDGIQRAIEDRP